MGRTPLILFLSLSLSLGLHVWAELAQAQDAAESGSWELLVENAGISSMHTAVTRFGTVILLDRTNIGASQIQLADGRCRINPSELQLQTDCSAHSVEFTPGANTLRPLFIFTDTWCSSGQFQADGTLVQTGGDNDGFQKVRYFAPCADGSCDWVESDGDVLQDGRWYASNALLPDNRQIVVGGRGMSTLEFLPARPAEGALYSAFLDQTRDAQNDNLYPYVHLLPDDTLFIFANRDSIIYDYKSDTVVRTLPQIPGEPRNYPSAGSSVMLPLVASDGFREVEILVCGGSAQGAYQNVAAQYPASQTCGRIALSADDPQWVMEDMPIRRTMGDMLILPSRDVLIINGAENGSQGWGAASNPVFNPVLYSPSAEPGARFALLAPTTVPRLYHSSANLLPDGRILVAGSNTHQFYTFSGTEFPTELRIEAFSPPYLNAAFRTMRPVIETSPEDVAYGDNFQLLIRLQEPVQPEKLMEISLLSSPFTTHSYSMGLRALRLDVTNVQDLGDQMWQYTVAAPPSAVIAPSAYYMLFAVFSQIPSVAVWVRVG
ncbi:hypothetical protein MPTK1_5g17340 [Marchantia polymorpha subsp. ruderalis]|uniref:Uncharacterized protein n=2 Tax=Marchantia polymorpha TaxID=3197 RepID=A0AAF6BJB5_MARPO|nr:hypothetical protein MARPO_0182s0015 [Marchantia polymorpha]BBN12099.1 hypothetical protein Mp_5g17340 [Marchantia polymorpha subsp. ruderalis]|eukprot:PTQ27834.1 hypothetical protein MARPO_0182s0015 [Marchantia polymorpha]